MAEIFEFHELRPGNGLKNTTRVGRIYRNYDEKMERFEGTHIEENPKTKKQKWIFFLLQIDRTNRDFYYGRDDLIVGNKYYEIVEVRLFDHSADSAKGG